MRIRTRKSSVITKSDFFVFGIILFPIANLITGLILFASYYDEIIGIFSIIFIFILFITKKMDNEDRILCILLLILSAIGLVSNVVSKLISNYWAILIDVLWLWKTFACFIAFKYIAKKGNRRENIVNKLVPIAKFIIWFVCIVSLIGQFINLGVTGQDVIGGIKEFDFFWHNAIQLGLLVFSCIMILSASNIKSKKLFFYLILSSIPLFLTFSSLVYCWLFVEIFLLFVLKKDKIFKKRYIVILGLGVGLSAFSDIQTYFISESTRMRLIIYGIKTANTFFPLGSGFATYGSDMAVRFYSKLYSSYGWEYMYGIGRTSSMHLNDNFFASIIGQFGWIGFILYLICLYNLFSQINTVRLKKYERIAAITTIITLVVSMIGSATGKSMMGICTFVVLGVISGKLKNLKID